MSFRHPWWLLMFLLGLAPYPNAIAKPAPTMRILFVGNSQTLTNALPRVVEALAKQRGVEIAVETLAEPDYSLADHLAQPRLRRLLHRDWDWVVLQQGPSSLPASRAELLQSVRLVATELRSNAGDLANRTDVFSAPTVFVPFTAPPLADIAESIRIATAQPQRQPISAAWRQRVHENIVRSVEVLPGWWNGVRRRRGPLPRTPDRDWGGPR